MASFSEHTDLNSFLSSACNEIFEHVTKSSMSFINSKKSNGPKLEPCVVPQRDKKRGATHNLLLYVIHCTTEQCPKKYFSR